MNVMTYSVALYAGAFEGMADGYEALDATETVVVGEELSLLGHAAAADPGGL